MNAVVLRATVALAVCSPSNPLGGKCLEVFPAKHHVEQRGDLDPENQLSNYPHRRAFVAQLRESLDESLGEDTYQIFDNSSHSFMRPNVVYIEIKEPKSNGWFDNLRDSIDMSVDHISITSRRPYIVSIRLRPWWESANLSR